MKNNIYISQASLKRLPKYLRILKEKESIYISSTEIADSLNLRESVSVFTYNDKYSYAYNSLFENEQIKNSDEIIK